MYTCVFLYRRKAGVDVLLYSHKSMVLRLACMRYHTAKKAGPEAGQYVLLYSQESGSRGWPVCIMIQPRKWVQRLACMCYYTAIKMRSKG